MWSGGRASGVRDGDIERARAVAQSCIDRAAATGATRMEELARDVFLAIDAQLDEVGRVDGASHGEGTG